MALLRLCIPICPILNTIQKINGCTYIIPHTHTHTHDNAEHLFVNTVNSHIKENKFTKKRRT